MDRSSELFIQENSPDGGFLQSQEWAKFQESVGRKTYGITGIDFNASIIEHRLPLVGSYFYIPRGPVMQISNFQFPISNKIPNPNNQISKQIQELIELARKNDAGWVRIEPQNSSILERIGENWRVAKAPHDMQPKETFVINITKPEEELLAEMKPKTRYNIRLAEKKRVRVFEVFNNCHPELVLGSSNPEMLNQVQHDNHFYIEEFLRLVKITAKRDKITPHPDEYYCKMFEVIPEENIKLYVAEYNGQVSAANIMIFYGKVATYLHGASDNEHRNLMAPYLLQWQAIRDAKKIGCEKYDFGGVSANWEGITRFKAGFSPNTKPIEFPGSYDIIVSPNKYRLYRLIQRIKSLI